jgi:hypothetical protein
VIPVAVPASPVRRARALRVEPPLLRFAEGQFGGSSMPTSAQAFEVAPPQTRGVQAIYMNKLPQSEWPWGMSALRLTVRYTRGRTGVVGASPLKADGTDAPEVRLWWSVASHAVQFALPEKSKLLPRNFRAKAIQSLLPSATRAPLPPLAELKLTGGAANGDGNQEAAESGETPAPQRFTAWQPVLPDSHTYFIVGARAGAPLLIRNFLICQSGPPSSDESGSVHASGAIPVQHRMPRPIPIPPNDAGARSLALQTWASHFSPTQNLLASANPTDNAFISTESPIGMQVELVAPTDGIIGLDSDGDLVFAAESSDGKPLLPEDQSDWKVQLELTAEGRRLAYAPNRKSDDKPDRHRFSSVGSAPPPALVKQFLAGLPHGASVVAKMRLEPRVEELKIKKGYQQTLSFPLRAAQPAQVPLPLRPVFAQFEDPEYNRRLASEAAHTSGAFVDTGGRTDTGELKDTRRHDLTLAADRREYNPTSEMFFVLFAPNLSAPKPSEEAKPKPGEEAKPKPSEEAKFKSAKFKLRKIKAGGKRIAFDLKADSSVELFALRTINLGAVTDTSLSPGDTLLLSVEMPVFGDTTGKTEVLLELRLDVVAQPVIPAPEAGYALLRTGGGAAVACVRFAWGPQAARVELTNPDDLTREVVRRRAVFHLIDVGRAGHAGRYALQKITHSGSTHFIEIKDFRQVSDGSADTVKE